jgi:hypothetical protein
MTIDRLGTHGTPAPDPRKAGPAAKGERVSGGQPIVGQAHGKASGPADQVILSAEALAAGASVNVPRGELPVARIREVGQRLSNGYYDQTSVIDAVTSAILRELTTPGSEPR